MSQIGSSARRSTAELPAPHTATQPPERPSSITTVVLNWRIEQFLTADLVSEMHRHQGSVHSVHRVQAEGPQGVIEAQQRDAFLVPGKA
jgi:hypothetical protein